MLSALSFSFDRQRKKRQDHRSSLKINKNRHDLYADELVGPLECGWDSASQSDHSKNSADESRRLMDTNFSVCPTFNFMHLNIRFACLYGFKERLTVGRKPESQEDLIPEGELILTINVYYTAIVERVSWDLPQGARIPPDLTSYHSFCF